MKNPLKLLSSLGLAAFATVMAQAQTFTHQDVGAPEFPGSATVNGTRITVVAFGHDIWDNADDFHYYYTAVTGPFDIRVRVEDLQGPDFWSKAELMARQDDGSGIPQGGDPQIDMMTTRVAGQNEVNMQWRQTRDGASNWPGSPANPVRPAYPNTWMRLVRSGDLFIGFFSTNGTDWQKIYEIDTANTAAGWSPWPNKINVGLAVTAHSRTDPTGATGTFNDLAFATEPVFAVTGSGAGFVLKILETSPALSVTTVNRAIVDGTNVTAKITQSKAGTVTTVNYDVLADMGQFFPAGSTHSLEFTFRDNASVDHTNTVSFTVAPYATIPASFAVTGVDTTKPGFRVRPYQSDQAQPNTLVWTEEQLMGLHGANLADLATIGADANGFVTNDTVINYDATPPHGNFTDANGFADQPLPGIPGPTVANADNSAIEVLAFLQFNTPGLYTMGVNSDDGFHVTSWKNPHDIFAGADLGRYDGGRGASDSFFDFAVAAPGIYPMRLIWENGTGGANVEWFTVSNGQNILINDLTNTNAIKAYYLGPAGPAYTKWVDPPSGAAGVPVTAAVTFTLVDADTQVDPATISVSFAGQTVTPVVNKNGATTTVTYDQPGNLASVSNYVVSITWSDNATPPNAHTVQTRFLTERAPSTLPAFQEDQDGMTVMESENFHALTPQGGSTWAFLTTDAGYSSEGYMQALPNAGVNRGAYPDLLTLSPRLDYRVNFIKPGLHYIWVRGNAISGSDDSLHGGIDGDNPDTARRIDRSFSPNNQWVWVGQINGVNPVTGNNAATLDVPGVGEHPINFWMREDGFKFDKIILTTNALFTPTGLGPPESGHVGAPQPPTVSITSPTNRSKFPAGADITITATASDVDGSVTNVEFFEGTNKLGQATTSPYTITWSGVPTGRYLLTAKATDSTGLSRVSSAVKVTVGTPQPQILLIVGDPNAVNASDNGVKARLEQYGYQVIVEDDTASQPGDEDFSDLIITSSTVGSGNVGNKFQLSPVPVVNWEQALQDNYLMTIDDAASHNSTGSQTNLIIVNESHPMAAGLTNGTYTVTASPQTFSWGLPASTAAVVATLDDGSGNACIYGYDQGAVLIDGTTPAPARRVMLFLENNTFAALNSTGLKLFDAAVSWALNKTLVAQSKFNAPVLQAGNITLSWTGVGTLEEADAITGPWNPAPNQSNPQTIPATGPMKFYRIKQ